jgi:hypothetical protein
VKVLIPACLLWGFIVFPARADIIYFKDGMRSICQEKAWEENDEIKCEYQGWVISYQKKDVLRIEKTVPEKIAAAPDNDHDGKDTAKKHTSNQNLSHSEPTGLTFYDPRRPYKYWTGKDSRHKSYMEAIQALAKKYKRPAEWIQANMGDTNDLVQIHHNLANPDLKLDNPLAQLPAPEPSGIPFYNPRREFPYWTDKDSKYKNYKEAIQALAQKYAHSPEWIQANMGDSNDLSEIHQNLATGSEINE